LIAAATSSDPMPMHGLLLVLGVALVALGFAMLTLPVVPGAAVMYFGILVIAWADDFSRIGTIALVGLAVLAVVGTIVDNIAGVWGARFGGASGWGVLGAALGALLGAAAFEFVKNPELKRAARAGAGSLAGFLLGIIAKYVFGILFVAVAAFVYFF
jgi:uncharacterized protein